MCTSTNKLTLGISYRTKSMKKWIIQLALAGAFLTQQTSAQEATVGVDFRLVDTEMDAFEVLDSGEILLNSELMLLPHGGPVLVFREVIISDEHITKITSEVSQEGSVVQVELNSDGAQRMLEATQENVGKVMAVVFTREEGDSSMATVISVATIRAPFSERFEITGLTTKEAEDLASTILGR